MNINDVEKQLMKQILVDGYELVVFMPSQETNMNSDETNMRK